MTTLQQQELDLELWKLLGTGQHEQLTRSYQRLIRSYSKPLYTPSGVPRVHHVRRSVP